MKSIRRLTGLAAVFGLLWARAAMAAGVLPTPSMTGHWEGHAQIVVIWCHHTNMGVKLDIHDDGSVNGTVGDAKLVHGRFESNRGWLLKKLNWATDYIVTGDLDGPVVAADGITRSSVKIPLNFTNGVFVGGVNTSGSGAEGFGAKPGEGTWMAARNLKLVRSP